MNDTLQSLSTKNSVDPITLEVIRHGIVSITDQIDANISRTAFSPYIYEYKDFAVGLVSAEGELIAQCTGGMPVFVADSVGMAVRDGLASVPCNCERNPTKPAVTATIAIASTLTITTRRLFRGAAEAETFG